MASIGQVLRGATLSAVLVAACALPSHQVSVRVQNDSAAEVVVTASQPGMGPEREYSQPIAAGTVETVHVYPHDGIWELSLNGEMVAYWKCWPREARTIDYSFQVRSDGTTKFLQVGTTPAGASSDCST